MELKNHRTLEHLIVICIVITFNYTPSISYFCNIYLSIPVNRIVALGGNFGKCIMNLLSGLTVYPTNLLVFGSGVESLAFVRNVLPANSGLGHI